MPIDMWSLGCILAELYTGFAILPGEDESDQLACIIELLGMPPKPVIESSKRAKIFFNAKGYPRYCSAVTLDNGSVIMQEGYSRRGLLRGTPGSRKLKHALNGCDDVYFLQFISECLEWTPEKRLTPEQAFKHSWFKRRLPKLPHASGNNSSGNSNFPGNAANVDNATKQQPQSLTTPNTIVDSSKDSSSGSGSSSAIASNKGITASCFYFDNTLHQLNVNNNQQHATSDDSHKSLPGNSTYHHGGASASKLSDKYQSDSYREDLSNRKSMTLNRLMSSSLHSASTLSLVSSHNSSSVNSVNNNGSSAASHLAASSKLPSLN